MFVSFIKTSAIGNYNIGTFSVKAHFFDLSNPTYYTVWSEPFTFTATKVKKNHYFRRPRICLANVAMWKPHSKMRHSLRL